MSGRKTTFGLLACLLPWIASAPVAGAAEFKVLVQDTPSPQTWMMQVPFWTKTVPEKTNGALTATLSNHDQMGLDDKAILRLLKMGVFDFATFDVSKMSGDDPRFEGCDLAGLSLDFETVYKACDAYRPVIAELMEKNWNAKLLSFGVAPPQVFWCNTPVTDLASLKGKKVRVFNKSMIDLLTGIGAEPISMNFGEVVPSLQRGVIDCAVTGTLVGNTGGWTEVSKYYYPLYLGWSVNVTAANIGSWNKMSDENKAFFEKEMKQFELDFWKTMEEANQDAENCNFNKQPCKLGKLADMTLVPMTDKDQESVRSVFENVVLKRWGQRVGPEASKEWNDTVGKTLNMKITAP